MARDDAHRRYDHSRSRHAGDGRRARRRHAARSSSTIEDATATDTRTPGVERGEGLAARALAHPYFVQMKGLMTISGRDRRTRRSSGEGAGFFETYR